MGGENQDFFLSVVTVVIYMSTKLFEEKGPVLFCNPKAERSTLPIIAAQEMPTEEMTEQMGEFRIFYNVWDLRGRQNQTYPMRQGD